MNQHLHLRRKGVLINELMKKIILISGPTASGKSKLALNIAKKIKGEIINADSMQVYKQLNILTARPTIKEQKKIKHHLYGIVSVSNSFSTGHWLKLAIKKIYELGDTLIEKTSVHS